MVDVVLYWHRIAHKAHPTRFTHTVILEEQAQTQFNVADGEAVEVPAVPYPLVF